MSFSTTFGHINALILGNTIAKSQNEPHRKLNKKKVFQSPHCEVWCNRR
jgi:hypothetical protein